MVKRKYTPRKPSKKAVSRRKKTAVKSSKPRARRVKKVPTKKAVSEFAQAFLELKNRVDRKE
jgi:hypothetical protein